MTNDLPGTRNAYIFDLDGTLLNSLEDIADSVNSVLRAHGLPLHPLSVFPEFVGDGMAALVLRAVPQSFRAPEVQKTLFSEIKRTYAESWHNKTRPYPGIVELIKFLEKKQKKMAVLSNKPHDFTLDAVKYFFDEKLFACVRGARPGIPLKPDPRAALEIASELGENPESCVFVGDSNIDIFTARSAGMFSAGAGWGFRGCAELEKAGADMILKHPRELKEVLSA